MIITEKSSGQLEAIIRAKKMFLYENEMAQGNIFEIDYVSMDYHNKQMDQLDNKNTYIPTFFHNINNNIEIFHKSDEK